MSGRDPRLSEQEYRERERGKVRQPASEPASEREAALIDALRRVKMRAIDAYNECGDPAPQDFFLHDIERIADVALAAARGDTP